MAIKDKISHQKLTLDVNQNDCLSTLEMKQGDQLSRFVDITLVASGEFINLSELADGKTAKIIASMNGELRQNSEATINNDGTVTVEMDENALGEAGVLDCEIRVTDSSGGVLSSALFLIRVGRSAAGKNTNIIDVSEGSIDTKHIKNSAITAEKIAEGSITGEHIASDSIGNMHLETDSVQNANLVDKAVTPTKLDRAYWEKNAPVSNQILDRSVLFDTVGFVNVGGSIAFLNLDLFVSTDTYTGEVTKINGFCYAMGVKFTSVETVYLINVTDGSMWKINRTNTGDAYVPVYTYDFIRQSVATADIADGAVTEDKLSHRFWHRFGSIPTVGNDSVFASMLSDDCISLIKLSTDTYANMGEGPFAGFPMGNNRYSLINLATGELWCASKDEGFAVTSIYTPVKVDSQLSEKSTNAVENRLVTAALNKRLKTLVSTATAADTDVIGSLTDDNYVGLVQSATSDVLSYKFESWRDPIAQTVTQYRTFLSSGVRECRTAQLTDGSYVWGEWTELEASVVKADFVYAGTFSSLNALCAYGFKENIKYLFNVNGELAGELTGNVCEGYIEPYNGTLKITTPNNHSDYFSVDLTEKTMEYIPLIDSELSDTSSKPVQNKVVTKAINELKNNGIGADGKSAYEIAVSNGFEGTEEEWLESLKGADGENGQNGTDGVDGADGTSVTIVNIEESTEDGGSNVVTFSNGSSLTIMNGSKGSTGEQGEQGIQGVQGEQGNDGKDGVDGVSATHSWNGTTLTVTSASGTSSADLKGDKGDKGDTGEKGEQGEKGDTYTLTDTDKEEIAEIAAELIDRVPDYWLSALEEGAKAINTALCTAGSNKSAFLFYTDAHWNYGSQMSPVLLKYLYQHTGMTKINFGGDIVNDEGTEYDTMSYLWQWRNALKDIPNHHSVVGNHDDGNATNNLFSEQYVYGYLLAAEETPDMVRGEDGLYYYIDSSPERTRYLYLDTAYKGVTTAQQEFIKNALLTTPEGWHIVAISHIWHDTVYNSDGTTEIGDISSDASVVLAMFDNYNSRTGDYADCGGWVEFCIGGHTHQDYDSASGTGIPIILVETDSKHVRSGLSYKKDSTTEASVNGIIADYDNHKIYVVRVGRGESREVEIINYVVTYTNVLPLAVASDGETIYNEIGYKADTRWSSSSNAESTSTGVYLTGYIPVNAGDVIRLKNITMPNENGNYCMVHMFTSITDTNESNQSNSGLASYYGAVWDDSGNLAELTIPTSSVYTYIRIQCGGITEASVITINEKID